jgi:hypothetical protein
MANHSPSDQWTNDAQALRLEVVSLRLNNGNVLGEGFKFHTIWLHNSDRNMARFSCFDIPDYSVFTLVCAVNDFATNAIF